MNTKHAAHSPTGRSTGQKSGTRDPSGSKFFILSQGPTDPRGPTRGISTGETTSDCPASANEFRTGDSSPRERTVDSSQHVRTLDSALVTIESDARSSSSSDLFRTVAMAGLGFFRPLD